MIIREATLDDISGIVEVHKSDIKEWQRGDRVVDYNALSVSERWNHGGPWMSVETLAIHCNFLLLHNQQIWVAEKNNHVVGACEVFTGEEAGPYGCNANLSVLYVLRSAQRRGVGRKLLQQAKRVAASQGYLTFTVHNPASRSYYEKQGFSLWACQFIYTLPSKQYRSTYRKEALQGIPPYKHLLHLPLQIGHYQSSWQTYLSVQFEVEVGWALPLPQVDIKHIFWLENVRQKALVILKPLSLDGAYLRCLAFATTVTVDLIKAILNEAWHLGGRHVELLLGHQLRGKMEQAFKTEGKSAHPIMGLHFGDASDMTRIGLYE